MQLALLLLVTGANGLPNLSPRLIQLGVRRDSLTKEYSLVDNHTRAFLLRKKELKVANPGCKVALEIPGRGLFRFRRARHFAVADLGRLPRSDNRSFTDAVYDSPSLREPLVRALHLDAAGQPSAWESIEGLVPAMLRVLGTHESPLLPRDQADLRTLGIEPGEVLPSPEEIRAAFRDGVRKRGVIRGGIVTGVGDIHEAKRRLLREIQ